MAPTRRRALQAFGLGSVAALAGCSGLIGDESDNGLLLETADGLFRYGLYVNDA